MQEKITQIFCVIFIAAFAAAHIFAQAFTPNPQAAAKIEEYMKAAVEVNRFSGSILVAQNDQTVYSKGYGMANYELDVPNTPRTVFRIGSLTNPFTATAIMMLKERGKLDVNDSICKYLDDCPTAWQPVTVRHLLTHTSGIPDYVFLPDYSKTMALPVDHASLIGRFKNLPLEFAPGDKFNFSSSGYYLLGVIVERLSGKSYADFLQENIFQPLGMNAAGVDNNYRLIKNRASGYAVQSDGFFNARYLDMSLPFAAGAICASVEDLLRFQKALDAEKLLTRKSLDEMYAPFKEIQPGIGYAYGWRIGKQFGHQATFNSGQINGFASFMTHFPTERVSIFVLSNNQYAPSAKIAADLSAIVFGEPYKIPEARKAIAVDEQTLERYVGQYQPAQGSVITVTLENGKLMRQVGTQPKVELFAETKTDFFIKGSDLQIRFVTDSNGRATGQLLRRESMETLIPKVK